MSQQVDARRGRPRDPAADERILQAAGRLILERGMDSTTVDDIAEAAGVGKATVYRRWARKDDLAIDALGRLFESEVPQPDTGSLRGDLEQVYADAIAFANTEAGLAFIRTGVAEACRDPRVAELYKHSVQRRRDMAIAVFERAIRRGEISDEANVDLVIDGLTGLLIYRAVTGEPLPKIEDVPELVGYVMRGLPAP